MKAVMYHYVRRHEDALPHQRFLHADDFVRQLDHFAATDGFVDRSVFEEAVADGRPAPGIVLTFDDALRDHAEVVWPLLEERDLWGIFYVPSAPYRTGRLLDVHRLHVLTGSLPGTELLRLVRHLVDDDQLVHDHVEEFHRSTYGRIDDDAATDQVKRTLNYLIADEHRAAVVDALMVAAGIDETDAAAAFYASPSSLRAMAAAGMVIGSHGDRHVVLSTLPPEQQRIELTTSFRELRTLVGAPIETFCYPFGGHHSFDRQTISILEDLGVRYAFNVEPRDIEADDLVHRPLVLPRYDCNAFPHGRAHRGRAAPV